MKLTDTIRRLVFEELEKIEERIKTPFSRDKIKTLMAQVYFDPEVPTYDVLTGIRVIKNVATVYSIETTLTSKMGRDILNVKINYIPVGTNHAEYIDYLARTIRQIRGVHIVKLLKIGKKRLTKPIGPINLVY